MEATPTPTVATKQQAAEAFLRTGILPAPARTFTVTVIAADPADALARADRHIGRLEGFETTGRARVTDARHLLCEVEVADLGGDVDDAWVVLTSYGMTPGDGLGSGWQTVAGVGR